MQIALGLVFLMCISDAFVELYDKLKEGIGEMAGEDPENEDECKAENVMPQYSNRILTEQ